ncbi:DNA alkylation repair protein [Floricoccus penangensis]|uniref:DNA alkylation repair protein n=1 Tax=Floricoccus penangensis TaxID=1859475 RepID=A0A9Q5JG42_9LACT|nr:DNA alkylation repair protein [Floricoccus penangensis]OFI46665.1 DNA alkylation repair protein [Floricoccus penangensis]
MEIFDEFYKNANLEDALKMSAYMKNNFPFLGIKSPKRREISKDFLKSIKGPDIDWEFIEKAWNMSEREFQYLALDYLKANKKYLQAQDIPKLKELALKKSWWDSIDIFDRIIGDIVLRNPEQDKLMLEWSKDSDFWLRRLAIDHQLTRKEKTKPDLLGQIIKNNLNQTEFFINKAIGWSLRDYSKTNPKWVTNFIKENRAGLSPLSIREGSKYI